MDDISNQSDSGYYAVIFSSQRTEDEAGYILCPSDHFIYGDPTNLQAFADAAKECIY